MHTAGRAPFLIMALALVLLGLLAALWYHSDRTSPLNVNTKEPLSEEQDASLQRARSMLGLVEQVPESEVQDRIELIGDEFIGAGSLRLGSVLEKEFKVPAKSSYKSRMTTRDAVPVLSDSFAHPPKYLVLDLGRSDAEAGIGLDETYSMLTTVTAKARDLGISVVLIGGVSTTGDTTFASLLQGTIKGNGLFVDATPLQSDPSLRTNSVLLNAAGVDLLAAQIVRALRS